MLDCTDIVGLQESKRNGHRKKKQPREVISRTSYSILASYAKYIAFEPILLKNGRVVHSFRKAYVFRGLTWFFGVELPRRRLTDI